jgi:hypothetical protein
VETTKPKKAPKGDLNAIGKAVRKGLIDVESNQDELASYLNIHRSNISHVFYGNRPLTTEILEGFIDFFRCHNRSDIATEVINAGYEIKGVIEFNHLTKELKELLVRIRATDVLDLDRERIRAVDRVLDFPPHVLKQFLNALDTELRWL